VTSRETVDARKTRFDNQAALALARSVDRIINIQGKKVITLNIKDDAPDDATLLAALMGPSGNLRAPTLRQGRTLIVGFAPEVYQQEL
jgi:arsenate reductase-like glutaredoxin family protein